MSRQVEPSTPQLAGFPAGPPVSRQPPGLTTRKPPALMLGRGALDEGNDEASDMRFDGRRALTEKFCWRPVAPTRLDEEPFGENAEGLLSCCVET